MYACPSMPPPPCPPECPPSEPKYDSCSKYYREIGTTMIGNQLIIRMERKKGRKKKARDWDPPCDCDVVEIQRPTSKEGPKILNGVNNNEILFRVESQPDAQKKTGSDSTPQAIYYKIGECKGGPYTNDQCRTFTVYPVLNGSGGEEVHTDRVTEGDENVFMLKVKKKPDPHMEQKRNIEIEMRTPKLPPPPPPLEKPNVQYQIPEQIVAPEEDSTAQVTQRKEKRRKEKGRKK